MDILGNAIIWFIVISYLETKYQNPNKLVFKHYGLNNRWKNLIKGIGFSLSGIGLGSADRVAYIGTNYLEAAALQNLDPEVLHEILQRPGGLVQNRIHDSIQKVYPPIAETVNKVIDKFTPK